MRPRVTRIPRRVWLASAALHAAVAGGLYLLLPTAPTRSTAPVSSLAPAETFSLSQGRRDRAEPDVLSTG